MLIHEERTMNKIYQRIFSKIKERWLLVLESVAHRSSLAAMFGAVTLVAFLSFSETSSALDPGALPTNGTITSGKGNISTTGSQMTVKQSSQKMIANWDTFNIGAQSGVTFKQPNANSTALNRINDQNPSQILGTLSANGKIYLINPSGIVFGEGAQVNVGGLVASSLNMADSDFLTGKYTFLNTGNAGSILNQGNISVIPGGVVALIGPSVTNEGTITANKGSVVLGAGNQVTLDFKGDGLISYKVDKGAVDALAANKGLIKADGGLVVMTAQAADSLTQAVVNNSGVIEAQTLKNKSGRILLLADGDNSTTVVGGKLDASAPKGGNGGFIETSGNSVNVSEGAIITTAASQGKTGTWEIDPYDFTIAASGGDITGAAVTAALVNNNVTIRTTNAGVTCTNLTGCGTGNPAGNGDIFVNDNISWSSRTLTLNAWRNIVINKELFGSGTAKLILYYGQWSASGTSGGTTATYTVNAPVDLPAGSNGATFVTRLGTTVGNAINYYVLTTLGAVGSTTGTDLQGMYGHLAYNYALGGNIDASPTSGWNSGAGFLPVGYFTGNDPVNGTPTFYTGTFDGLGHTISNLYINRPTMYSVGLFGMTASTGTTSIQNVGLVGGSVTGSDYVGELAGRTSGIVTNVYATGSVTGAGTTYGQVGGLIGRNRGTITNAYATGSVTGTLDVGGLVGWSDTGNITNVYATGSVTGGSGSQYIGGLVGYISTNTVSNAYATGSVSGTSNVGGFAGYNGGTISNSYWDTVTSGQATSAGGTGLTTAQMMQTANFSGWDFTNTWWLSAGNTRPFLRSEYMTTIVNAHELQLMAMDLTKSYTLGANINMSELTNASGMWNTAMGFVPIGDSTTKFTGTFNGQNYTITNLTINRPSTNYVGLFGYIGSGSTVSNVGLVGGSVSGQDFVGELAGYNYGTVNKTSSTGSVSSRFEVGGLIGWNSGTVSNSYATGSARGIDDIGGLAGGNFGTVSTSYATGSVNGSYYIGGLLGCNFGTVSNSYATGSASGSYNVGGLIGGNFATIAITNTYATGLVNNGVAGTNVGGLVGGNFAGGATSSFWDTLTTGQASSAVGTASNTTNMKTKALTNGLYSSWNTSIWNIVDGSYPTLKVL